MSRQKAPEPQPQPPPHGLAPRRGRQAAFSPPGFPGTGANDFQDSLPGCIISDVRGQSAPISSPLLPRWSGDTGRQSGQQLGWLSWSPGLLFPLRWPRSNCFHPPCYHSPPSRRWRFHGLCPCLMLSLACGRSQGPRTAWACSACSWAAVFLRCVHLRTLQGARAQ